MPVNPIDYLNYCRLQDTLYLCQAKINDKASSAAIDVDVGQIQGSGFPLIGIFLGCRRAVFRPLGNPFVFGSLGVTRGDGLYPRVSG